MMNGPDAARGEKKQEQPCGADTKKHDIVDQPL
jgi:hypothetical protein